jgi:hypothetical protein
MGQTYIVESDASLPGGYKHITIAHVHDDGSVTKVDGAAGSADFNGWADTFGIADYGLNNTNSANSRW